MYTDPGNKSSENEEWHGKTGFHMVMNTIGINA